MKKLRFKRRFTKRVLTRFHMSLILLGTALSGLLFSKLLLISGLNSMVIRYIIVLIFAYLCFFILMKLWLVYLTTLYRRRRDSGDLIDVIDLGLNTPDFETTDSPSSVIFRGGESGGGGACGSWAPGDELSTTTASECATAATESVAGTATEAAGEAASGIAEEGGIILIPLALLLLVIFGGGIYLIVQAPAIISEAAFELILATSLIKRAKRMDNPDWIGSVFRATWPAFVFTLVVTIILGFVATSYCPQATKLTEVVRFCLRS